MDDLELAALLCSRLCHDLVSPVGAVINGVEVMGEDDDPEMLEHAVKLIASSAESASAKLKFLRVAFGSASTMGDEMSVDELQKFATDVIPTPRISMEWAISASSLPKDLARLLLNMILISFDTLPRGGVITVGGSGFTLELTCDGTGARMDEEVEALMQAGDRHPETPRESVPFLAGRLSQAAGLTLRTDKMPDSIRISAT